MRITWEKIVNHVETIYGQEIINELHNKKRIKISQPKHNQQVKDKHLKRVERLKDHHSRIIQAREVKLQLLEEDVQRK